MKRVPTWVIFLSLGFTLLYIFDYQANDAMLMKHWIELIWVEILAQSLYNRIGDKIKKTDEISNS